MGEGRSINCEDSVEGYVVTSEELMESSCIMCDDNMEDEVANDASEMIQQNKNCNEDDLEEELSGNDDIEGQIELVIEQMNDSNDVSQHAERQAESLVEDVSVDDRLIEEYNAWYQLE